MRVIEVGDGAGFGQVGFGIFGSIHQLAMRHLDGHEPLQLVVVGQVDEAEAALAQHLLDPVATDVLRLGGGNGQGGGLVIVARLVVAGSFGIKHGLYRPAEQAPWQQMVSPPCVVKKRAGRDGSQSGGEPPVAWRACLARFALNP